MFFWPPGSTDVDFEANQAWRPGSPPSPSTAAGPSTAGPTCDACYCGGRRGSATKIAPPRRGTARRPGRRQRGYGRRGRRCRLRDREVIVLRYFENLTAAKIASVTRQSVNATEVRLHGARARLAAQLGAWHAEEQP